MEEGAEEAEVAAEEWAPQPASLPPARPGELPAAAQKRAEAAALREALR